ncbi:response regulator [Pseudoalteromonas xiamenensis]|uniref:Response regulator n=1 Tax=Pseudoalteromonas xiamenensis TaxID=882626 RepID=A0A975HKY0_9GAMM|nr:response regulator [Pseudoalteromonas xiamenensis]QTH71382.1 response regulator [Pseudoalteromonas xiamenensis]
MNRKAIPIKILMADDDEDDQLLTRDALAESRVLNAIEFVKDGEQLLNYLRNYPPYDDVSKYVRPDLILLDLNMPKMDGREALEQIKQDANLRSIPVVILTTSLQEEDKLKGYDLGAASYISKPVDFQGLVTLMRELGKYWIEIVELPR